MIPSISHRRMTPTRSRERSIPRAITQLNATEPKSTGRFQGFSTL